MLISFVKQLENSKRRVAYYKRLATVVRVASAWTTHLRPSGIKHADPFNHKRNHYLAACIAHIAHHYGGIGSITGDKIGQGYVQGNHSDSTELVMAHDGNPHNTTPTQPWYRGNSWR